MTTQAGQLSQDWIADCRSNEGPDSTLETWIMTALNCREASIDAEGSVWIEGPQAGHWLDQDEIDRLVAAIDAGV